MKTMNDYELEQYEAPHPVGPNLSDVTPAMRRRVASTMICICKRSMDVVIALPALICLALLLPLLSLLIKIDSKGPILYRQMRVGRNRRGQKQNVAHDTRHTDVGGKPFVIYKLRTMSVNAEEQGPMLWAGHNDSRVTRLGARLRALHLDELPQFWNVLAGEMSFIGPRPERPCFVKRYLNHIPCYLERTRVKPGLTGLAQVLSGYDTGVDAVRKKVGYDLTYIARLSSLSNWAAMELRVIWLTLRYILSPLLPGDGRGRLNVGLCLDAQEHPFELPPLGHMEPMDSSHATGSASASKR